MKRGVKFVRPKKLSPEQKELILKLREEGKSATELGKTFNVDRFTIYRLSKWYFATIHTGMEGIFVTEAKEWDFK